MGKRKKILNCFLAQRISNVLTLVGVAVGFLGVCLRQATGFRWLVFPCAAGFILLIAGLLVGWFGLACPHCREPLYEFPRLPREIPCRCPHCGREIAKES